MTLKINRSTFWAQSLFIVVRSLSWQALALPMSKAVHSWERPERAWDWEPDDFLFDAKPWDDSESDDDISSLSEEECGERFASMLVELYMSGRMTAKTVCTLAYWAKHGGIKGSAKTFAMTPTSQAGHCARRMETALGLKEYEHQLYRAPVPGHSKLSGSREIKQQYFLPPHEAFAEEAKRSPGLLDRLEEEKCKRSWSYAYERHPIVMQALPEEKVLPLAIFIDGVPFAKKDSMLAFYVYNLVSKVRHVSAVVRKTSTCQCGCRGWCTLYVVFEFLKWSLQALKDGIYPTTGVTGEVLSGDRATRAGTPIGFKGAVVQVRGDWAEFANTFGFCNWSSNEFPCFLCNATASNMYCIETWNVLEPSFDLVTPEKYERECLDCEIQRTVSKDQLDALLPHLKFDKRKNRGYKGLALFADYPPLLLRAGDRVEPSKSVPDIGRLEHHETFPLVITFWRTSNQKHAIHRMPLFDDGLGISVDTIALDTLHTLHLGIMNRFVCFALWQLLLSSAWAEPDAPEGARPTVAQLELKILRLRSALWIWYSERHADHPLENLTRLQNLTMGMLGSVQDQVLKAKGAETKALLLFTLDQLELYKADVPNSAMVLTAGQELATFLKLCDEFPAHLTVMQKQASF